VPQTVGTFDRQPNVFPDYRDVTVPPNIAPLNFKLMEGSDECVVCFTLPDGKQQTYGGSDKIIIPEDEWHEMLAQAKGKVVKVEAYVNKDGWRKFRPFTIAVAEEEIDPYISYRLISPSYVAYEMLSISQRNLTNFDEREIYNNMIISSEDNGQCINCHAYKNYKTDNLQFHMRQGHGGTMIVSDGKPYKVDLKTDSTISAGVYPAWHPRHNYIAYSTNATGQSFHTKMRNKIEVIDSKSDLILYDVSRNEVSNIANDTTEFECFPTWSPDGKYLYFCSAHFEFDDSTGHEAQVITRYQTVKYNLYRKAFDPETKHFGPTELVYDAAAQDKSVTFPRVSPDGRYVLFAQGGWGCFHVWHPDADLYVTDLQTLETRPLTAANSDQAESFHNWSSNGRWILFISRRDDGNFSRLYMAYFDKDGQAHKAFELPQKDPNFYQFFLKSYNVPEFMIEPVGISPQTFAKAAKQDAKPATFVNNNNPYPTDKLHEQEIVLTRSADTLSVR